MLVRRYVAPASLPVVPATEVQNVDVPFPLFDTTEPVPGMPSSILVSTFHASSGRNTNASEAAAEPFPCHMKFLVANSKRFVEAVKIPEGTPVVPQKAPLILDAGLETPATYIAV